jgi:hypothetical protein
MVNALVQRPIRLDFICLAAWHHEPSLGCFVKRPKSLRGLYLGQFPLFLVQAHEKAHELFLYFFGSSFIVLAFE